MRAEPSVEVAKAGAPAAVARLRVGSSVVARIVEGAGLDGRGTISLAGFVLGARLPRSLAAGQTVRLHVAGVDRETLVLRLAGKPSPAGSPGAPLAEPATSGDGGLPHAAETFAPGVAHLPGGCVVELRPDDGDGTAGEGKRRRGEEVRLVLHTEALGALELHVHLTRGSVSVDVIGGEETVLVARGVAEILVERVQGATGLPAYVAVAVRQGPPPARPPTTKPPTGVERRA